MTRQECKPGSAVLYSADSADKIAQTGVFGIVKWCNDTFAFVDFGAGTKAVRFSDLASVHGVRDREL